MLYVRTNNDNTTFLWNIANSYICMHALSAHQTNIKTSGESKYVTFCLCLLLYFDTWLHAFFYTKRELLLLQMHTHTHTCTYFTKRHGWWLDLVLCVRIRQWVKVVLLVNGCCVVYAKKQQESCIVFYYNDNKTSQHSSEFLGILFFSLTQNYPHATMQSFGRREGETSLRYWKDIYAWCHPLFLFQLFYSTSHIILFSLDTVSYHIQLLFN